LWAIIIRRLRRLLQRPRPLTTIKTAAPGKDEENSFALWEVSCSMVLGILSDRHGTEKDLLLSSRFIDGGVTGILDAVGRRGGLAIVDLAPDCKLPFIAVGFFRVGKKLCH
jgi:hypothetical protein